MNEVEAMRRNVLAMVEELRATMQEIGNNDVPDANVVSNARDRLRYISALTEQAAGQTLQGAEAIADRLNAQRARAGALMNKTRSAEVRAFLEQLQAEHQLSSADTSEIIQAQAFQDLVGQVVNKLLVMVQHMEENLVHLLVAEEPGAETLAGPVVREVERVSQHDVDDLFG